MTLPFKTPKYNMIFGSILFLMIIGIVIWVYLDWVNFDKNKSNSDKTGKQYGRVATLIMNIVAGLFIFIGFSSFMYFMLKPFEKAEIKSI